MGIEPHSEWHNLESISTTQTFASVFAQHLSAPLMVGLKGDLGTGKTAFVQAVLYALAIEDTVKSPTFTLVESYQHPAMCIHHWDLYRIRHPSEFESLGFQAYDSPDAVFLIEWPDAVPRILKALDILIEFEMSALPYGLSDAEVLYSRRLRLSPLTPRGQRLCDLIG